MVATSQVSDPPAGNCQLSLVIGLTEDALVNVPSFLTGQQFLGCEPVVGKLAAIPVAVPTSTAGITADNQVAMPRNQVEFRQV